MVDTEQLHAAQLLYALSERMQIERHRATSRKTRDALDDCITRIDEAADHTALGYISLEEADIIADSGEEALRRFRAMNG